MPPAKSRVAHDDASAAIKEKSSNQNSTARGRRTGQSGLANGSSLKEVTNASADPATTVNSNGSQASQTGPLSSSWSKEESALLHSYRSVHRLDTPSSYKNPLAHVLLSQGIGKYSPTMARNKSKRRVSKDSLALAIRKNFNATAVNEQEVIVDFLYKVKMKDRDLRVRFAPPRK